MNITTGILMAALTVGPLATPLRAQDAEAPAGKTKADPSGTWRRTYDWNSVSVDEVVRLNLKEDGKVVGKLFRNDVAYEIHDGKYENKELSFSVTDDYQGTIWTTSFSGAIKGDEIDGTVALSGDGQSYDWPWTPKRSVQMDDVLGTWQILIESPDGTTLEPTITISKQGDQYTGAYTSSQGWELDVKKLGVEKSKLMFTIAGEVDTGLFQVDYKGRPYGDKMSGSLEYDFAGSTGEVEFTAKRKPAPRSAD
jgi:hypothetical protein